MQPTANLPFEYPNFRKYGFVSLAVCISPAWPGSDDLRIQSVRIEIAINTTLPIFLQIIINYSNPGCSIPSPGPPAC